MEIQMIGKRKEIIYSNNDLQLRKKTRLPLKRRVVIFPVKSVQVTKPSLSGSSFSLKKTSSEIQFDLNDRLEVIARVIPKRCPQLLMDQKIKDVIMCTFKRCFSLSELLNLRLTCKTIKEMIDALIKDKCVIFVKSWTEVDKLPYVSNLVWMVDSTNEQQDDKLSKIPIRSLTIEHTKVPKVNIRLSKFTNLVELELRYRNLTVTTDQKGYDRIRSLKMNWDEKGNVNHYLKYFTNLTELKFCIENDFTRSMNLISSMTNLVKLTIGTHYWQDSKKTSEYSFEPLFSMVQLEELQISLDVLRPTQIDGLTKLSNLTSFGYMANIRPLENLVCKLPKLSKLQFNYNHQSSKDFLPKLNLTDLKISFLNMDTAPKELSQMSRLTSLSIFSFHAGVIESPQLSSIFPPNLKILCLERALVTSDLFSSLPKSLDMLIVDCSSDVTKEDQIERLRWAAENYPTIILKFESIYWSFFCS